MTNIKKIGRITLFSLLVMLSIILAVGCDVNENVTTDPHTKDTSEETTQAACAHTATEWAVDTPATCTSEGSTKKTCKTCKQVLESVALEKLAHTETKLDGRASTCTEKGLTEGKKCSVCDTILVEQKEIALLPHTEALIESKNPTCIEKGLTEGKKCSVCNTILVEQKEIALIPHTEALIASKNPTCIEKGLTEGKKCSVCNTVLVEQNEIPTIPHTEALIESKTPTCDEKGLTEGKKCSSCNTVIVAQTELDALGHSESDWIIDKAAELGIEGSRHKECIRCGKISISEKIAALTEEHVHASAGWIESKPATCSEEGEKQAVCSCGAIMETVSIPMLEHTPENTLSIASTCISEGVTAGKKCSHCGKIIEGCEPIPKSDHIAETVLSKAPSCIETGFTSGKKCSHCGIIIEGCEPIPKSDHIEETVLGKAPTCVEMGQTDGKKCSVCGTVTVEPSPIATTSHTVVTVLGTSPTCTVWGTSDSQKCSICSIEIVAPGLIPPKGHSFASGGCTDCGMAESHGIWIVDGLGIPVTDVIVKIMKDGETVKMYPYKGEFLPFDIETGSYTIELDLEGTGENYIYDESALTISPDKLSAKIRLFKTLPDDTTSLFVGSPVEKDYDAYYIAEGSYKVSLTPNDYTFFIFAPTSPAIYALTYECDTELKISYHGGSFFVQGTDLSENSSEFAEYKNGLAASVYAGNIGCEMVFAIKSTTATECIFNIENVGDPGTRLVDQPWTPCLEDENRVQEHLNLKPEGTYTQINVTDMTISAVFNKEDGYYHLNSADGPIIFIDITSDSKFVSSIQKICGNQRMGAYIYDINGNVVEKRSYNELFWQYGMPNNADEKVKDPIRIPLTEKLAEAVKTFGDRNGWWSDNDDTNIFTSVLLGTPYNQDIAWLLYCGYYVE